MPSDNYLPPPPYRDPSKLPREQRIGLTINEAGKPFEHFCAACSERAPWGFRHPRQPDAPERWFCGEHRAEGEAEFRKG